MSKQKQQQQPEPTTKMFTKKVTLTVQSPVIAPALPSVKLFKKMKLQVIAECYKKYYEKTAPDELEDILEKVSHLDRAFERFNCQPIIAANVISAILQEKFNDKSIFARGMLFIPLDKMIIDEKKRGNSLMVFEEILPETTIEGELLLSKDISVTVLTSVHAMRTKGYGQVILKVE